MASLLTTAPVISVLTFLESNSNWLVTKLLGPAWAWNSAAVLNGTASPDDTVKFLAFTMIMCHSVPFFAMNMGYTIVSWIVPIEKLAPYRFNGTIKIDPKLLTKVIIYVCCFHVVISVVMVKWLCPFLFAKGLMGSAGKNFLAAAPTFPAMFGQLLICLACTDCTFYWGHKFLHDVPFLYQYVHKMHHEVTITVGWACVYANPIELIFGNILPVLSGPLLFKFHPVVWFVWMALAMYGTITGHSGFTYPSGIRGWHDMHHHNNCGNYGTLSTWDRLMGTTDPKWYTWQPMFIAGTLPCQQVRGKAAAKSQHDEAMARLSAASHQMVGGGYASPAEEAPMFGDDDDNDDKKKSTRKTSSRTRSASANKKTRAASSSSKKRATSSKKKK